MTKMEWHDEYIVTTTLTKDEVIDLAYECETIKQLCAMVGVSFPTMQKLVNAVGQCGLDAHAQDDNNKESQ
jgi:hypothetical protein